MARDKNLVNNNVTKANVTKAANSQKVLLPTLKEQQRYVVYEVHMKDGTDASKLDFVRLHEDIMNQCSAMLGIFDGAKAGLILAKFNSQKMKGIIRVDNKYVEKFKICLGLIKDINIDRSNKRANAIIDCVYVSGMLNKAQDEMDG